MRFKSHGLFAVHVAAGALFQKQDKPAFHRQTALELQQVGNWKSATL